mmetsp:Transcript_17288/g.19665  ORF Transcript_17288/g.19665 Transcript_17288/m.19665 type:complete len:239 (+) Transcript_17288:170-886(+)
MLETRVNNINSNDNLLKEYQERKDEIESLTPVVEQLKEQVEACTNELHERRAAFELPMKKVVADVNERFTVHFRKIHEAGYECAGEVKLMQSPEDPIKYGISIRVKFRSNQKMQQLSADVQSGGERSLSTFLYLLSLQDLARSPFRVVDEINQGMDAQKERLAFARLIEASCTKKSPQYFLITPKLLRGLKYDKNVTINFVFNGPHCISQEKWNKFYLKKRSTYATSPIPLKRKRIHA